MRRVHHHFPGIGAEIVLGRYRVYHFLSLFPPCHFSHLAYLPIWNLPLLLLAVKVSWGCLIFAGSVSKRATRFFCHRPHCLRLPPCGFALQIRRLVSPSVRASFLFLAFGELPSGLPLPNLLPIGRFFRLGVFEFLRARILPPADNVLLFRV